jgi:YidC/Oxa1 family membrane protein insertase
MDKRFFLFLILAAIILIVTPKLFPPQPRAPQSAAAHRDSVAAAAHPAGTTSVASQAPSAAPSTQLAAPARAGADTGLAVASGKPDTVVVSTPRVLYRFSTVGAAPIGVALQDYKALSGGGGNVQLVRGGVPLVEYRLLTQSGDTIPLQRAVFTVDSSALRVSAAPALSFRTVVGSDTVAIAYTFAPDSYLVRVRGQVRGSGARPSSVVLTLPEGLRSEEADTLDDQRHFAYVIKPARDDARSIPFGKLDQGVSRVEDGPLTWIASKTKYFVVAAMTDTNGTAFSRAVMRVLPQTDKVASSATAAVLQPISATGEFSFELYTGPQEWRRLLALGRDMEHVNPYGGFFQAVVQPFATLVMRILLWMHGQLRINYGWVLIIFGVVVRVVLWPLNQSAMRSSLKMQRIQPELQALQRKYKNNPEKQHTEMMRLYREHGMSPLSPLMGCLPMLIPMPVLFALFFVFQNTIEFRGVSFLWMADISLKDPFYILPIVMGVSMFLLSWIGLRSSPPNPQAKMMAYIFPVAMTVFFLKLPAGLNLYYAVQNVAALPQQWLIARERAKVAPPVKATS